MLLLLALNTALLWRKCSLNLHSSSGALLQGVGYMDEDSAGQTNIFAVEVRRMALREYAQSRLPFCASIAGSDGPVFASSLRTPQLTLYRHSSTADDVRQGQQPGRHRRHDASGRRRRGGHCWSRPGSGPYRRQRQRRTKYTESLLLIAVCHLSMPESSCDAVIRLAGIGTRCSGCSA